MVNVRKHWWQCSRLQCSMAKGRPQVRATKELMDKHGLQNVRNGEGVAMNSEVCWICPLSCELVGILSGFNHCQYTGPTFLKRLPQTDLKLILVIIEA